MYFRKENKCMKKYEMPTMEMEEVLFNDVMLVSTNDNNLDFDGKYNENI